jgi:hypothetical protein
VSSILFKLGALPDIARSYCHIRTPFVVYILCQIFSYFIITIAVSITIFILQMGSYKLRKTNWRCQNHITSDVHYLKNNQNLFKCSFFTVVLGGGILCHLQKIGGSLSEADLRQK